MKIKIIFTCYNRKEKTFKCIRSLIDGNLEHDISFIIVDDNSTDGTLEMIKSTDANVSILEGNGSLFWAGGMRKGIDYFLSDSEQVDYVMFVNDDVDFNEDIINRMIKCSLSNNKSVVIGATCDEHGNQTYGALRLIKGCGQKWYESVVVTDSDLSADTFNCNCVLFPYYVVRKTGSFDPVYKHSLADLDYGLTLKRMNVNMLSTDFFVGVCSRNESKGTWTDPKLSRVERIRKKESPKGAPAKIWFHFMKKNFGLCKAIRYSITPFIKILLGK